MRREVVTHGLALAAGVGLTLWLSDAGAPTIRRSDEGNTLSVEGNGFRMLRATDTSIIVTRNGEDIDTPSASRTVSGRVAETLLNARCTVVSEAELPPKSATFNGEERIIYESQLDITPTPNCLNNLQQ